MASACCWLPASPADTGTAAAVGSSFANLGFPDALDIGQTCATVGILAGVFGGMFFIKLGTKKGWTSTSRTFPISPVS